MTVPREDDPIVTIFADQGPLVSEISEKIRARGARTHMVSVDVGWVDSVSCALLVLDSVAGMSAMRGFADLADDESHVVVLIADQPTADAEKLCEGCRDRHGLVMMRPGEADLADHVADRVVGRHRR